MKQRKYKPLSDYIRTLSLTGSIDKFARLKFSNDCSALLSENKVEKFLIGCDLNNSTFEIGDALILGINPTVDTADVVEVKNDKEQYSFNVRKISGIVNIDFPKYLYEFEVQSNGTKWQGLKSIELVLSAKNERRENKKREGKA